MSERPQHKKTPYTPDITRIEADPLGHLLRVMDLEYNGDVSGEDVYSGSQFTSLRAGCTAGKFLPSHFLLLGAPLTPPARLIRSTDIFCALAIFTNRWILPWNVFVMAGRFLLVARTPTKVGKQFCP